MMTSATKFMLLRRTFSSSSSVSATAILKSAVICERLPVVTRPLSAAEKEWRQYRQKEMDSVAVKMPAQLGHLDGGDEMVSQFWAKPHALIGENDVPKPQDPTEVSTWYALQRTTKEDETNNTRSLYRRLWSRLYLLVKKPRAEHSWQFPQGHVESGETLRAAAEREFREECDVHTTLNAHFLGNAPVGCVVYDNNHVFLFHSLYLNGQVSIDQKEIVDYAWVPKSQLKDYIQSPELLAVCEDILLD